MSFFKIPKIKKLYNFRAIFLSSLNIEEIGVILKISKTRFFQAFSASQKGLDKTCFLRFWRSLRSFRCSNYSQKYCTDIIQLLYFWNFEKTHKFVKISKTSGNTLEGLFWYGEIMSLLVTILSKRPFENVKMRYNIRSHLDKSGKYLGNIPQHHNAISLRNQPGISI